MEVAHTQKKATDILVNETREREVTVVLWINVDCNRGWSLL